MIDALSTTGNLDDRPLGAWNFDRVTLEWLWKLISLSFPEYIMEMLTTLMKKCSGETFRTVSENGEETVPPPPFSSFTMEEMAVSRADANILSLTLLLRMLHKFLMLDEMFAIWHAHSPVAENVFSGSESLSQYIPAGTVLTLVNLDSFVPSLMRTMLAILQRVPASNLTSIHSARSFVEHSLIILFGLLQSSDHSVSILHSYSEFYKWIRTITLRVPSKEIRQASSRRILECFSLMLLRCRDSVEISSRKASRVYLFHFFFHSLMKATHPGYDGSLGGQFPQLIKTGLASPSTMQDFRTNKALLGPERYQNAEELYDLLAGILTLRSRPEILNAIRIGSFEDVCGTSELLESAKNFQFEWVLEEHLCYLFVEKLFTHRSKESFHSAEADGTLIGILRMLIVLGYSSMNCQVLLGKIRYTTTRSRSTDMMGLIAFLFFHCLFPQCLPQDPSNMSIVMGLCQTPNSRHLAYALLLNLAGSNKDNLSQLVDVLTTTFSPLPDVSFKAKKRRRRLWEYDPTSLVKAPGTSLGLVNQGATCYMNSFLQQLYHVKGFSNTLLSIDCDVSESDNAGVLFELQVLFGYLRYSQKSYCDTISFCKSFKDYDGEPVKLGEQKDVYEFATMLFDKLEMNLDCKALLGKFFGGKLVWQIISTESSYRSEREEPFFILTAEVKDKESLEDSLELYVAGEMLTGDNKIEDSTGKKVDALRRCAIRQLPDVLFIHLKRFEFDLETMNRRKLNDFMTFPEELNMLPYTEEGIRLTENRRTAQNDDSENQIDEIEQDAEPRTESIGESAAPAPEIKIPVMREASYYHYRLKGIVAHTGAIDSGHYYSFIREDTDNTWMEYNDSSVLCFDAESIPGECFGGPATKNSGAGLPQLKQYNAYILVYERRPEDISQSSPKKTRKDPLKPLSFDPLGEDELADAETEKIIVEVEKTRARSESMTNDCGEEISNSGKNLFGGYSLGISEQVMGAVWSENTSFLLDRTRFHVDYFLFHWKLLELPLIGDILEEITAREEVSKANEAGKLILEEFHLIQSLAPKNILSKVTISCLEVFVEIFSRARAQLCLPDFIEKLEDIVMRDVSGSSAEAILLLLSRDPNSFYPSMQSSQSPSHSLHSPSNSSHDLSALSSKASIETKVSSLLLTIFLDCPHTRTISLLTRLINWCIKILRPKHSPKYLEKVSSAVVNDGAKIEDSNDGVFRSQLEKTPVELHRENEEKWQNCEQYASCVVRLIGKLLLLVDYFQADDLFEYTGRILPFFVVIDIRIRSCFRSIDEVCVFGRGRKGCDD
jgi:ubiquitin C-terminal hydrolase